MNDAVVEVKMLGFLERELSKRYEYLISLINEAFSGSNLGLVSYIVENIRARPHYARQLINRELAALQNEIACRIADFSEIDTRKIDEDPVLMKIEKKLGKATAIFEIMDRLERMAE